MDGLSRRDALGLGGIGAAALAAGVLGAAGSANAATVPTDLPPFTDAAPVPEIVGGCVGLARGQTARLSFHIRHILGTFPPDPVDVAIRIRDLQGNILAQQTFTDVPANHGGLIDFPHPTATRLLNPVASRIQLVGEVEHTTGYTVGGTLEVISQSTGSTVASVQPSVIPAPETNLG